jgi:hypothetical protein
VANFRTRCQQAPPAHIPYRFFLTAPLFGVLAGLLMLFMGPQAVSQFWHPVMVGNLHLLGLGMFTMAMAGLLLQSAPILSGRPLLCSRHLAAIIHALLSLGSGVLAYGFVAANALALQLALLLLLPALIWFALVGLAAVWRVPGEMRGDAPPAWGLRLGLFALLLTSALGAWAAFGQITDVQASYHLRLVQVHSGWAIFGWGLLFLFGFSLFVLPGFYEVQTFRPGYATMIPGIVFASLTIGSILVLLDEYHEWFVWIRPLAYLLVAAFAGFWLLAWSRVWRAQDVSIRFWWLAMLSLFAAIVLWLARMQGIVPADFVGFRLLLGILLVPGFMLSLMTGLFYKLLPCLQDRLNCGGASQHDTAQWAAAARRQFWVYLLAVVLFVVTVWIPRASHVAGGVFVAAQGLLFLNLWALQRQRFVMQRDSR